MKNIIKDKRLLLTIAVAILIVIIAGFLALSNSSKPETTEKITEPTSTEPIQQEKTTGTETEESVDKAATNEPAVLAPEEEKTVSEETGAEKFE